MKYYLLFLEFCGLVLLAVILHIISMQIGIENDFLRILIVYFFISPFIFLLKKATHV